MTTKPGSRRRAVEGTGLAEICDLPGHQSRRGRRGGCRLPQAAIERLRGQVERLRRELPFSTGNPEEE